MNSTDPTPDPPADPRAEAKQPAARFATPGGTVALAVLLWIAACMLAVAAVLVLPTIEPATPQVGLLLTYAAFAPATVAALLSLVLLIVGSVRWAVFGRSAPPSATLDSARYLAALDSINRRLLLSETAKKITYRAEDLAVLRDTLEQDLGRGEYEAAMVLVSELAGAYGQLEEAERFRARIEEARQKQQEEKIAAGIQQLDAKLVDRDFDAAAKEAARLRRLYPEDPAVADLGDRVAVAKEQYKHELERAFLQANEREEVDRALDIMKVLDKLLTAKEAAPFREVARGVVGKKRDNLGVQFKLAVHDRDWTAAVAAGEQIIKQFPNTRMADEVRSRIDQLRANAGNQQTAAPGNAPAPSTPANAAPPREQPAVSNTGISFTQTED
ncbi:MAG: hypothetical protein AAF710_01840 [Planctomycetota bacterium]